MGALALALTGTASAGYGAYPNGQTFEVTTDGASIDSPSTLDFVVALDAQDRDAYVWVSATPTIGAFGTPDGTGVGSCSQSTLIPFGEPGKWVCRVSTILMQPGRTYYWWLDFGRVEDGSSVPQRRISGPFPFTLVEKPAAPATTPPAAPTPPQVVPPATPAAPAASTATAERAAVLPTFGRFTGTRSIKHATLTRLVYRTMKQLGTPRQLAFACWNTRDWRAVVEAEGATAEDGQVTLAGFWLGRQPRWLHLSPRICSDVQGLLDTKQVNARRAFALTAVIHETLHANGVYDEAATNCYAVQLVPFFGVNLGLPTTRALYLGTLARNITRRTAPNGYWNARSCRDGGRWDLLPRSRNLG
jgi:hypothetical protein